ncbi:hypothetical protein VE25_08580 [Devosia geojensis]|uniref:Outer membrane protein beta-barrel domain-containing protein n=1 Tax=Devosia geojensis TaxID=443610 RepID=A0A0F5FTC5_9HYPH|nr:hypothetical protein [Devosia geojensis]KKB12109.1 hypothetical protein VE25_08580 [Devosia geojensis]
MSRTHTVATVSSAVLMIAAPALAADYSMYPELRPAYPNQWTLPDDDPLRFEVGLRYWYSKGEQTVKLDGEDLSAKDTSHILEGHFRIDDFSTSSYLKGMAGYAIATDGEYTSSEVPGAIDFEGGHIGYAGADFGYLPFGNDRVRVGAFAGYQYNREAPDIARVNLWDVDGLDIHSLRLGLAAKAEFNEMFDITAEVAGVPYAYINGSTPEYVIDPTDIGGGVIANRAVGRIDGAAYGASAELMAGVHPTPNLTIRAGARAWFLKGPATAEVNAYNSVDPDTIGVWGVVLDEIAYSRLGGLLEITGRF